MISIDEVKLYLNIDNSELNFDIFIEKCIESTFSEIENYCRQPILISEQEKNFEIWSNSIVFNQFPISNISSVEIYDNYSNLINTLSITDYTLTKPSSLYSLIFKTTEYSGYLCKVKYSCGYTIVPTDIQKVNLEMAALMFKESDAQGGLKGGRLGLTSSNENVNQISNSISFKSPIEKWNTILNKYRAPIG